MEQIKKGYKKTEVGVIPEDWGIDKIKNLALIKTGSRNTQDKIEDGNYPFFVRSQIVEKINSYSFDGEAVLTAGDGVGVGKVMHYINEKFDCHQRVYRITDFNKRISGYYFYLYFSNNFLNRIMQMTAKSSVDSVRMEMIADMQIPIPPTLTEQKSIATALSDVDELINSLDKLISKKKAIKQGAMQELLKPKEGENLSLSKGWEVKKLGEICEIFKGKGISKSQISESGKNECILYGELFTTYKEVILCVVSKTNIKESILSKKGDILYPGSTTTTGIDLAKASVIMKDNILLGGDIIVLRKAKYNYNSIFLAYFLNEVKRYDIAQMTKGITIHHLYGKDLANIYAEFPSIEQQNETATILSDMDTEIEVLEGKKKKYQKIKQGMMQELLTGKTRLL